jgi:hypothetical protein
MILLLATYRLLGLYILCGLSLMHYIFVVFFQGNTKMNLVMQDLIVKVKKKNNNMASRIDSNEIVNNVHNSSSLRLITIHRNILVYTLICILHTKEREFWRIQAAYKTILHQSDAVVVTTVFIMNLAPAVYYIHIKWSCKWNIH